MTQVRSKKFCRSRTVFSVKRFKGIAIACVIAPLADIQMAEYRNEERRIERESRNEGKKKSRLSMWLILGVVILIALLLIWLTVADLFGDTDVAAQLLSDSMPILSNC